MFVCDLYRQSKCKLVNNAREELFKIKLDVGSTLPPNCDSLTCHIKRVNYPSCINRKCLETYIKEPSPSEQGWLIKYVVF